MTFRFLAKLTLTVLVSMATACKIDSDSFGFNGHGMGIARAANAFGVRTVGVSELDLPDRPLTFYPRPSELATTQSFTHGIHTRNSNTECIELEDVPNRHRQMLGVVM